MSKEHFLKIAGNFFGAAVTGVLLGLILTLPLYGIFSNNADTETTLPQVALAPTAPQTPQFDAVTNVSNTESGNATQVSAGAGHTVAIDTSGVLWSWGSNYYGQLGDGTTTDSHSPVQIMENVASVSAGRYYTMAIDTNGTLWGWGLNDNGRLGDGTTENRHIPTQIMENIAYVSAGTSHTMAIDTNGTLWGWGANFFGTLGVSGMISPSHIPIQVMENIAAVSAGGLHTMAIDTNGTLWSWGWNRFGQLGDGTEMEQFSTRNTPVEVMSNIVAVSAGVHHTMAIDTNGTLWGWGRSGAGRLGAAEIRDDQNTPIRIMENITAVSAGEGNTMAIDTNGTLWGWGRNIRGQLGNGTTTGIPGGQLHIEILENVAHVFVGREHTTGGASHILAVDNNGVLWAWGSNYYGQLGDGTTTDHLTPVPIM